ncbi:hypothetical protein L3V79_06070 [Thiotrichales bacterium 19S9-12]|nr:hypothetical protein [Thiotrichales bacterium 19S9-11]MCF6811924.1 hypothetical protein [Thiotrichales bacterium 19S9-12]
MSSDIEMEIIINEEENQHYNTKDLFILTKEKPEELIDYLDNLQNINDRYQTLMLMPVTEQGIETITSVSGKGHRLIYALALYNAGYINKALTGISSDQKLELFQTSFREGRSIPQLVAYNSPNHLVSILEGLPEESYLRILQNRDSFNNSKANYWNTPLHYVAQSDKSENLKEILKNVPEEKHANLLNIRNKQKETVIDRISDPELKDEYTKKYGNKSKKNHANTPNLFSDRLGKDRTTYLEIK